MTQEEFDIICKELLDVSSDTYYTEDDLSHLASKYSLTFMGEYFQYIPITAPLQGKQND